MKKYFNFENLFILVGVITYNVLLLWVIKEGFEKGF
jgi:hypothetical protein